MNIECQSWFDMPSTYYETGRCWTSCSIVSYILFYGQPFRVYSCIHNEIACHVEEAQQDTYYQFEVTTSMNYWFLMQVHVDFMRKFAYLQKNLTTYLFSMYDTKSNVCFHEVSRYYDKDVQFLILLYIWHLGNTTMFSFPKRVV